MHIVILTCPNCPPIHFDAIHRSNPYASISVYYEEHWGEKKNHWRNADRMIRNWWMNNRKCFPYEKHFVILEWDVYVNDEIIWVDKEDALSGKNLHVDLESKWEWWKDADKLPSDMTPVGLSPLCCLSMTRDALDEIARPKWDSLFQSNIFCELRLPSIVYHSGMKVTTSDLPYVSSGETKAHTSGKRGIFHSVKQPTRK